MDFLLIELTKKADFRGYSAACSFKIFMPFNPNVHIPTLSVNGFIAPKTDSIPLPATNFLCLYCLTICVYYTIAFE